MVLKKKKIGNGDIPYAESTIPGNSWNAVKKMGQMFAEVLRL